MDIFLSAIVDDDTATLRRLLKRDPGLAVRLIDKPVLSKSRIFHWIYVGDTALHLAAAGYRVAISRLLLAAGADPNANENHRGSTPLHYAADGCLIAPAWNPEDQVKTIALLLDAGANIDAQDKNGASALHRAVRTRSAAAVGYLLKRGSDALLKNKPGSTPFHLAVQNTGRGGSGAELALTAQRRIIEEFLSLGLSPELKNGNGKTVFNSARSEWIRALLTKGRSTAGGSSGEVSARCRRRKHRQ
jgi:hypothetical protein